MIILVCMHMYMVAVAVAMVVLKYIRNILFVLYCLTFPTPL